LHSIKKSLFFIASLIFDFFLHKALISNRNTVSI